MVFYKSSEFQIPLEKSYNILQPELNPETVVEALSEASQAMLLIKSLSNTLSLLLWFCSRAIDWEFDTEGSLLPHRLN